MNSQKPESNPLENLDQWEDFVETATYPEPESRKKEDYRNYDDPARDCVREFYRLNHEHQSFDFVMKKREDFLGEKRGRKEMTIIQAIELLNTLVDDSDPDIDLPQIQHLLQTSESIRSCGCEDWFVLVGLIHDLGKLLCTYGEPQWAVVGDTFPVGCQYSDKVVYPEFFELNPDFNDSRYNTGAKILPPAQPAFFWYSYQNSSEFPLLGSGGRTAMAGPTYYQDDYPKTEIKFPKYYDGKLFIYEWMRGWMMSVTLDEEGNYVRMERFLSEKKFYLLKMINRFI